MKRLTVAFLFFFSRSFAQEGDTAAVRFDKHFIDAEDKWVILPTKKADTSFSYGFVYMDAQAGLTLQAGGSFSIEEGKLKKSGLFDSMSVKYRLQPNDASVAVMPASFLKDLNLPEVPEWLHIYKEHGETVPALLRLGYIYNEYESGDKALTYLEKAYKIDPHYKRLEFEMAFAYNITDRYDKAIAVAESALQADPTSCLLYKELSYAYIHSGNLAKGEEVFEDASKHCADKNMNAETAYNLAVNYYTKKDKQKAAKWIEITRKNATPGGGLMRATGDLEIKNNK